ncbi:MAG: DUF4124 domain-containing protein [Desulfobacterales bacterium]|nr:DUF4124 domain-containing protein [Desulfobacterales bacterium]
MKSACVWFMGLLFFLIAGMVQAGTVYYWTDENGVRHFSNTGPPDDVQEVGTKAETRSTAPVEAEPEQITDNEPDPGTPVTQEDQPGSSPTFRERAEAAQQERLARQSEDERRRLQAEIEQVEQRSLSRTFTEGMRDARLNPLRQQLALLDANPAEYFRMKQEGAFVTGGRTSSNRDRQGGRTGAMRQDMQQ